MPRCRGTRYAVRMERPRLVRVRRTYSGGPTRGKLPCAFGTYAQHAGGAGTHSAEAPGHECTRASVARHQAVQG